MGFGPTTEEAEWIGDVILRGACDLAAIIECNGEAFIAFKSAKIVNTSMAPQNAKDLWIPSQGIDDSVIGATENGPRLIYSDSAAVVSDRQSPQVHEASISPPEGMCGIKLNSYCKYLIINIFCAQFAK